MNKPTILRKRYIPNEIVDISGDEILFRGDELIVTKWKPIKPRSDIDRGISYAFIKEGYKVSLFYGEEDKFLYWYCDVIEVDYEQESDTYTLIDLLIDVKIMPDGEFKILDVDELAEAMEEGLITKEQAFKALKILDKILNMIYNGTFPPEICKEFVEN